MAYASVSQTEHESIPYEASDLANSPSPTLPQILHRPLSLAFDDVSGQVAIIDPTAKNDDTKSHGGGGMLKSLSSGHSYEMVEEDDYEEPQTTPRKREHASTLPPQHLPASEQPPVRTASVSRHLPLKHPIPDLQSMQGAYVKNVERLEESAERLSMTSSIDEEVQKMKSEQRALERRSSANSSNGSARRDIPGRQFSSNSLSNSIIGVNNAARTGGYSPSAYITSPTGSIRSGSWARGSVEHRTSRSSRLGNQLPDLDFEGNPLDFGEAPAHPLPAVVEYERQMGALAVANEPDEQDRPPTTAANDTRQQGDNPFTDFDGVHYGSRASFDRERASMRHISLNRPPLARDSKAFKEPQPGEKMIYYPAPVPVMLNLPTRLSKMSFADREKRQLQALSGMPDDARKSAAWLNNDATSNMSERQLKLPPQLRASAFFDQPGTSANLQLKNGSAVQTLDSILDAAAHAPVSAFTDHPIAGKLGKEVYGAERPSRKSAQLDRELAKKRRSSLSNILKSRKSSDKLNESRQSRMTSRESKLLDADDAASGDELERAAAASIAPGEEEMVDGEDGALEDDDNESLESEHEPGFSGAPTTLLAELQMRKVQQKMRNRTAADAFPNGMHSTLLELDAVTQLQQKSRKTKHVTLAWEDHEAADRENYNDEDVPLGMLFPEKDRETHQNINRPMGLLEKKEMEDNEPLSHRRARLRGTEYQPPRDPSPVKSTRDQTESRFKIDLPGNEALEEQEGETLAQRRQRIKEEKEKTTVGNFASDMVSQLGLETDKPEPSKTPDIEETLGQRRKRLKEEAERAGRIPSSGSNGQARPQLKARHSMADILQAHPVGVRQISNESRNSRQGGLPHLNTFGPNRSQTNLLGTGSNMPQIPAHMAALPYYNHAQYMQPQYNVSQQMMYGYGGGPPMATSMGMNGMQYANGFPAMMADPMGPPLNSQQRAVIDRWRQGIA